MELPPTSTQELRRPVILVIRLTRMLNSILAHSSSSHCRSSCFRAGMSFLNLALQFGSWHHQAPMRYATKVSQVIQFLLAVTADTLAVHPDSASRPAAYGKGAGNALGAVLVSALPAPPGDAVCRRSACETSHCQPTALHNPEKRLLETS